MAVGNAALTGGESAANDVAVGYGALYTGAGAVGTVAIGSLALYSDTNGYDNDVLGYRALASSTNGSQNVAIGTFALDVSTTGNQNVAIGTLALQNSGGSSNTGVGFSVLNSTTGSYNIAIGAGAGSNLTSGNNNIDIGNAGLTADSSTIRIGSNDSATYIAGIYGESSTKNVEYVYIDSTGKLVTSTTGTVSSINPSKLNAALARLEARNSTLETAVARQQQEILSLTASLKEQASLLQKVSAQIQVIRCAPQVVSNN